MEESIFDLWRTGVYTKDTDLGMIARLVGGTTEQVKVCQSVLI